MAIVFRAIPDTGKVDLCQRRFFMVSSFFPYSALATPHFGGLARGPQRPSPVQRSSHLNSLAGWTARLRSDEVLGWRRPLRGAGFRRARERDRRGCVDGRDSPQARR